MGSGTFALCGKNPTQVIPIPRNKIILELRESPVPDESGDIYK
jgi:hypothetical protein